MKEGCTCHECGKKFSTDFQVSDRIWDLIKPANAVNGSGLLCGQCIAKSLTNSPYSEVKSIAYHILRTEDIHKRFRSIINGQGLTIPRIAVKIAIDDILHGRY